MVNLRELRASLAERSKNDRDETVTRAREQFAKRKDTSRIVQAIVVLDNLELKMEKYREGYSFYPSWDGWSLSVSLKVDGFLEAHDPRLAVVLTALAPVLPGKEWSSSDSPMYKERRFYMSDDSLSLSVTATLKSDTTLCRSVKVGVKTVEQEVFKFVCDGEEVSP